MDSLNSDCGCRIDSLGQGSSQMDQLKLALTWNRVDVAEDKIFTPDTDWPVSKNAIKHSSAVDTRVATPRTSCIFTLYTPVIFF